MRTDYLHVCFCRFFLDLLELIIWCQAFDTINAMRWDWNVCGFMDGSLYKCGLEKTNF